MTKTLLQAALLCLIVLLQVSGAPTDNPSDIEDANARPNEIFIEPAPGFPSLEDLGITPAELYNMTVDYMSQEQPVPEVAAMPLRLAKRYDPSCVTNDDLGRSSAANILACRLYLDRLGDKICQPQGSGSYFCHANGAGYSAFISGFGYPNRHDRPKSFCRHVAQAVQWVSDRCPTSCGRYGCGQGGFAAAYGNGGFVVATLARAMILL